MTGIISDIAASWPPRRCVSGLRASTVRRGVAVAPINSRSHLFYEIRPPTRPPPPRSPLPCHSNTYASPKHSQRQAKVIAAKASFMTRHSRLLPYFRKILLYLNPLTKA